MVRRTTQWLVVIAAAWLTGVVVAGGILAWRLGRGPVPLDFIAPALARTLTFGQPALSLRFSRLQMEWIEQRRVLKFVLTDIDILDEQGRSVGRAPAAYVGLSTNALAHGEWALSSITLVQPSLRLLRGLDGSLYPSAAPARRIGGDEPDSDAGRVLRSLGAAARFLCGSAERQAQFGYLKRAEFRLGHLTVVDDRSGMEWVFPAVDLSIRRGRGDLSVTVSGALPQHDRMAQFSAQGGFTMGRNAVVSARIRNVAPARLAGSAGFLKPLLSLDMPVSGDLSMQWSADGALQKATYDLNAEAGHFIQPDLYAAPVPIRSVHLAGHYDPAASLLRLDRAEIALGAAAHLSANGQWSGRPGQQDMRLDASLRNLAVGELAEYWPNRSIGARNWIAANLEDGVLPEGQLRLHVQGQSLDQQVWPDDAVSLSFRFQGLTAHFLRPMRPLTEGVGTGQLSADRFTLRVDHARADSLDVTEGKVVIDNLQKDGPQIVRIDATLAGSTADALRLIDQRPLGYASAFGLNPASVGGQSITHLSLSFPAIHALAMRQVDFKAEVETGDLSIVNLSENLSLDQGRLKLSLQRNGIVAGGQIALNGVPFEAQWREDFLAPVNGHSTVFDLTGDIDGAQWVRFGLPLQDYVRGPGYTHFTLMGQGAKIARMDGQVDFTDAGVRADALTWAKAPGIPATLTAHIENRPDHIQVKELRWQGGGLDALASARLSADFTPLAVTLDHWIGGGSDISGTLRKMPSGSYNAVVRGAWFNAAGVIQSSQTSTERDARATAVRRPDFAFALEFDQVRMARDVVTTDFAAHGGFVAGKWRSFDAVGRFANGAEFDARMADVGGVRKFTANTTNAGDLLRGLDIFGNLYGGRMEIAGQIDETRSETPLKGTAVLRDFTIQRAPGLAKLLTLASFTGIADTLAGDGINFGKLAGDFTWDDYNLKIGNALAHGPAMGITGDGFLDRRKHTLFLSGSVAPSYTLNTAINHIPLIGQLLTGGKGQGILGFNYRMSGPASNPDVSVNALSALTPGFLRGFMALFEGRKPLPGLPDAPVLVLPAVILPPREIPPPPPLRGRLPAPERR